MVSTIFLQYRSNGRERFDKVSLFSHQSTVVDNSALRSGPHFSASGLNTEGYSVSLRTEFECRKMRTRITPNMGNFYAVESLTES